MYCMAFCRAARAATDVASVPDPPMPCTSRRINDWRSGKFRSVWPALSAELAVVRNPILLQLLRTKL